MTERVRFPIVSDSASIPPPPPPPPSGDRYVIPPPHPFFRDLDAATPRVMAVPTLIAANILVYIAMGVSGVGWFTTNDERMIGWGVDFWPLTTHGQSWRLLTSAFVHFGLLHIAFNMWALYAIGYLTERLFGTGFFLLMYFACALFSSITSIWPFDPTQPPPVTAGASGAIFAIFGGLFAYLVTQPKSFPPGAVRKLLRTTIFFTVLNVMIGFSVSGISNSAHLGGLASGVLVGAVLARPLNPLRRRKQTAVRLVAGIALCVALVGGAWALLPKCPYDIYADQAAETLVQHIAKEDDAVEANFEKLQTQAKGGQLTATQMADRISREITPAWAAMMQQLRHSPGSDAAPERAIRASLFRYAQLNFNSSRLFAQYLRDNNPSDLEQAVAMRKLSLVIKESINAKIDAANGATTSVSPTTDPAPTTVP